MNSKHQLTKSGLDEYVKELERLKSVDRIKNIEALKDARAQGDLSENADYDAARDEQARIEARIKELESIIKNVIIINGTSTSNLGKTIEVYFIEDKFSKEFTLVGSLEADPANGRISNESPLGLGLLKAKVEEVVRIKTENREFDIQVKSIK
ncbi:MAG: transcription elongation factor GreA [Bacilli bacterium]|nr:transcription elongation factor GreA [Bacilli bacterium]